MMLYCMSNLIMDTCTAGVRMVLFGCILIFWNIGLVQTSSSCPAWNNSRLVNVCQDNGASLERNVRGWLLLSPSGAHSQQDTECKCYLKSDQQSPHMRVILFMYGDSKQYAAFVIDGDVVEFTQGKGQQLTISSETTITYGPEKLDYNLGVCMAIQKYDFRRSLTVRCKAIREEPPMTQTTQEAAAPTSTRPIPETVSMRSLPVDASTRSVSEKMSTLSQHTDKTGSTSVLTVLLYAIIGVGVFLIGIIVCCVVKRKRRSTNEVSRAKERTDQPASGTVGNAGASRRTDDNLEADSEYAYIDPCNVTASAKFNSKNEPAESDVYNHLNEVQPGSQSDNVYSTAQEYNTTKQDSGAMAKHGTISSAAESDVYNQLNEVQPGPHSDNVYSTTHVYNTTKQETGAVANLGQPDNGVYNHLNELRPSAHSDNIYNVANVHDEAKQEPSAMSSQYDSVELVQRKHHAPPESDYNVLSFP